MENKKIYFRNDDVNPNSNFEDIKKIYKIIKENIPGVEIYSAINIFGKSNDEGKPYPQIDTKVDDRDFYDVDRMFDISKIPFLETVISHGLFHFPHGRMSKQTQMFSILSSCKLLNTNKFLPPFNEWNEQTVNICKKNNIIIVGDSEYNNKVRRYLKKPLLPVTKEKWKNFDNEKFDSKFSYWLIHSWKFTPETFREKLLKDSRKNNE